VYPVFDVKWAPILKKRSTRSEQITKSISLLSQKATKFVYAFDYDQEGKLIGYNILQIASLAFVVDRKREIRKHILEPYWFVSVEFKNGHIITPPLLPAKNKRIISDHLVLPEYTINCREVYI
jgi:DNA topoisomerase IA